MSTEYLPRMEPTAHIGDRPGDNGSIGYLPVENRIGVIEEEEDYQEGLMDEAGNLEDFDMTPVPTAAAVTGRGQRAQKPPGRLVGTGPTVPGLRIRQLSPTTPTAHPPGQSIWFLPAPMIRAQITRHP